jgi:hypothetical protein
MSWWLVAFRPSGIRRCCGGRCLPSLVDFGAAGVRGQLRGAGSASVSDAGSRLQQRAFEFSALMYRSGHHCCGFTAAPSPVSAGLRGDAVTVNARHGVDREAAWR